MPNEVKKEIELEIAHVLFLDIVGYSKLSVNEQHARVQELNEIVRLSEQFRKAEAVNRILKIPTGDGMALVFYKSPEEPAQCAFEIAKQVQKSAGTKERPQLMLRMGIHSGPVSGVVDVNERTNVAGAGINLAQRVMDCGDAGHILLSHHVAEDLENYERWRPFLHDIGAFEVKHGVRVNVTNLYSDEVGNPNLPTKLQAVRKHRAHVRWAEIAAALLVLGAIVAAFFYFARRPGSSPLGVAQNSIAVLPFVNMSEDKANEFFSDGISEELLNLLAKIPQLQVTARTSSFSFKGKGVAIPEIARTLRVAHVLEGSVRKAGNSVRITAQLIKAGTDTHLWSQTYDRKLDDIFAIQDEIAGEVVKQLKVTLLGAAPKARTTDPEAYALYLQAVQLGRQNIAEAFKQSDALLRKVLVIDPRYAPAWDRLASNFTNETGQGLLPNKEGFAQAREAETKALALDPDYAPAHAGLGYIAMYIDNDLAGAAGHFQRALALDPADLNVLGDSATLLQALGRLDQALALIEAVARRDPVNVTWLFNGGHLQRMAGRFDAAVASYRSVLSLAPGRGSAHADLGNALLLKGDAKGALAELEQETSELWKMIGVPMAYHALGRKADSDAALAALIAKYEKEAPSNIAFVYAFCGDADNAFEWLDKAVAYQDPGLGEIVTENLFDKIHADPRWLPFLRKIGKAPDQLARIEFKMPPLQQEK
jgi:TolB-like protein/class 3 adenylate cyclase/Flp pilus assembly protein TadD